MESESIDSEGRLDSKVMEEVVSELWPDIRDREELHDLLLNLIILPTSSAVSWQSLMNELIAAKRSFKVVWTGPGGSRQEAYTATERLAWLKQVVPSLRVHPSKELESPTSSLSRGSNTPPAGTSLPSVQKTALYRSAWLSGCSKSSG